LERFFFTTGYSGQQLLEWSQRHKILDSWRRAVDQFPEFNATVYYEDALFLDLINVLPLSTCQSVLATLICMAVICCVFISDPFTILLASVVIFSICLGEFGLLYYCGITLDPISIAALIMSVGFSVDIPAHVCLHFHRTGSQSTDVDKRIRGTLSAVGFPVFQAGLSTILCVLGLLLAPLYMSKVFVLCMVFCIVLSLLHGFLIIPMILNLKSKLQSLLKS
jgi:predicted RND superfamily exporter protein